MLYFILKISHSFYRRDDRSPGKHSRICSCHFRVGIKENGPEIFKRNAPDDYSKTKKSKKIKTSVNKQKTIAEMVENYHEKENKCSETKERPPVTEIILQAELESKTRELDSYKGKET